VALGLRFNSDLDNWLREFHTLKDNWLQRVAKSVTSGGFFEASKSYDIACICKFDVFTRVGVHLKHTANAFALFLNSVKNRRTLLELTGVNTSKCQRTDEWVVHDLERKHGKRLFVRSNASCFSFCLNVDTLDSRNINWRRKEFANSVEKWLNALVLERCTTHYWVELNVDCTAAQKFTDLIVVWHIAIQVSFHCFFVDFNDLLD